MQARPYQSDAARAVADHWSRIKRTLVVMPTGTGKTILFSLVTLHQVADGARVLILAHRDELIRQAADKLLKATGLAAAIEKADECAAGCLERVVVGSVQTLLSPSRRSALGQFDVIIVDEAHHVLADSYRTVLDHWPVARVLGVTATPDRGDMRSLGSVFESLAYEYTLPRAIAEGFLSPIRAMPCPLKIDISNVAVTCGDFKADSLGSALDPYLPRIAEEIAAHARNRKTLAFLPLIATSRKFVEACKAVGLRAREVNGDSPDRKEALEAFAAGQYDVMANAMLLTEGYDCPSIDCVVCLRPTKVRSLYAQMCGRGTRPHPGKENLLLLDFLWMTGKHQLCRPAHLIAEDDETAQKMVEAEEREPGTEIALDEAAIEKAREEVIKDREAALAKKLAEMRHKRRELVDPIQFGASIGARDVMEWHPALPADNAPPTAQQIDALAKCGIFPGEIKYAGHAQSILAAVAARKDGGMATPKQVRCLEQRGWKHAGRMTYADAQKAINRIAANGWRVPPGMVPKE